MFICSGCEQQAPDEQLQYTLIHHTRVSHPSSWVFLRRFHSRECLTQFLERLARHADRYILTDLTGPTPVEYEAAVPREILQRLRVPAAK